LDNRIYPELYLTNQTPNSSSALTFSKSIEYVYEALIHSYILLKASSVSIKKLNSKKIKDYELPL